MEIIVFLSIVIAVGAVLTSIVLVRRVKKQIAEMTDVLVDVKNGNGNRRILSATNELTAPLAYEINEIVVAYESRLSTVRQTEETNRQLMTSLSHDVRTPLTILFFMERDNDTFKNLRTIPVTSTQMVLAKIIVLFLFGIVFCVASTIATILCGFGTLEVYGIGYKLFLAVETGIFITAGTLPLIVLVVFFSKTYVFSILLCVFYSVLNMSATALFDTLPKTMLWLLPTPLTTFWSAGDMAAHGIKMDLEQMTGLIPSTFQVVFILEIMAFVSFLLIDRLYKQRVE